MSFKGLMTSGYKFVGEHKDMNDTDFEETIIRNVSENALGPIICCNANDGPLVDDNVGVRIERFRANVSAIES